jgi:hypothetical protein
MDNTIMEKFHIAINTHSGWVLVLLSILASYAGGLLYVIPVSAAQLLLGLQNLSEPEQIAAANRPFVVLAVSSVAGACGISIGFSSGWCCAENLSGSVLG